MKVIIIHLSDLHIKSEKDSIFSYLTNLEGTISYIEPNPVAILILTSGDIVFSGKGSEYSYATKLYSLLQKQLESKFTSSTIYLVFVPGNHDCNFQEHGSQARTLLIKSISRDSVNELDTSTVEMITTVQSDYIDFVTKISNTSFISINNLYGYCLVELDGKTIAINTYNTAWMSQLHEIQGHMYMPISMLTSSRVKHEADIVISMFHHPYNWFESSNARKFKDYIETTSDIVITGHEHDPSFYEKKNYESSFNQYYEGGVLQAHGNNLISTFNLCVMDFINNIHKFYQYKLDKTEYKPTSIFSEWLPLQRNNICERQKVFVKSTFLEYLNDPGYKLNQSDKSEIKLRDIFVYPFLKETSEPETIGKLSNKYIDESTVHATIIDSEILMFLGSEQSCKTSLCKILFLDFINRGYLPIYINCNDIRSYNREDFLKIVNKYFIEQYDSPREYFGVDTDKILLLLDNFHSVKLNIVGKNKLVKNIKQNFKRVVFVANEIIKLEEISSANDYENELSSIPSFTIKQYGNYLRNELIEKWYKYGKGHVADPKTLANKIIKAGRSIDIILGKKYLVPKPITILTLLQAIDTSAPLNTMTGTFGYMYEILITSSLFDNEKSAHLDLKYTYLSNFAYYCFNNKTDQLDEEQLFKFNSEYKQHYKPPINVMEIFNDLVSREVIIIQNNSYKIKYDYMHYYFIARYIRDHIHRAEIKDQISSLYDNILDNINGNIIVFMTHLSKDPFIIERFRQPGTI